MICVVKPLPRDLIVACSGGVDSMAAVDFLQRRHHVTVAYFDHGTPHGQQSLTWLESWCAENNMQLVTANLVGERPLGESQEEFWRNQRYKWLTSLSGTVITAHHLDDCVETYVFNCLHGKQYTINYQHDNVVRPFLTTPKRELVNWCERNQIPWLDDPSNNDVKYMRNHIRHVLLPQAKKVNPGLNKVVKKIVVDTIRNSC